jgi:hypothetical protein
MIVLSAFITRWYSLSAYEMDWDEGNRMSIGHSLNHGRTLYVDAWDHHPFLDILAFQQVFRILPPEVAPKAVHLINILIVVAISLLIFCLPRRLTSSFGPGLFGACVALFLFPRGAFRSSHGEFYHSLTSLAAFALYLMTKRSPLQLAAIGLLLATGFLIKQSAIFDVGAFLAIHGLSGWRGGKGVRNYARDLVWLGAGAGTVVLLSIAYFAWHGSLREAVYGTFLDALVYSTGSGFHDTLDRYGKTAESEFGFLLHLHWLITGAIVFAYFCLLLRRQDEGARRLGEAAMLWLAFVLAGIMCIGRFYEHYFTQVIAPLSLVCAYAVASLPRWGRFPVGWAGLVLLYLNPILYPQLNEFMGRAENDSRDIQRVAAFLRANTRPGETVFLYRNSALCLYFLSERFPPVKTFMESQMLAEHKDGPALLTDGLKRWKQNPPRFIVTGQLKHVIPEIEELMNRDYRPHAKIGAFQIYKRSSPDRSQSEAGPEFDKGCDKVGNGGLDGFYIIRFKNASTRRRTSSWLELSMQHGEANRQ